MVVIIRATSAPFARAKAGDVTQATEAAQKTVEGEKGHDMKPRVYTRPARRRGLRAPRRWNSGSRPTHLRPQRA